MRSFLLAYFLLFSAHSFAFIAEFPKTPEAVLTPGSLCSNPDHYRYPEKIAYCKRSVDGDLKQHVFEDYRKMGYHLPSSKRADYKIDHFIPLCAGGSNREDNLWPQHVSVFTLTDPLESIGCQKLREGKLSQNELVNKIILAKNNLSKAPQVLQYLKSL